MENLENLTSNIIKIIKDVDDSIENNVSLHDTYLILLDKYPTVPASIIKILSSSENKEVRHLHLKSLVNLIENLANIQKGNQTMQEVQEKFRDFISETYIYPQFGGKENFEKKIIERNK